LFIWEYGRNNKNTYIRFGASVPKAAQKTLPADREPTIVAVAWPTDCDLTSLVASALAHHKAGRLDAAAEAYRAALHVSPGHAAITHNLGVIAATQGKLHSAISYFDKAIAAEPHYAAAHFNRALANQSLGQSRRAIEGFSRASALEPGHYAAHRALGFLWLAEGERGRALDHFARTYELRRGEDRTDIAINSLDSATRDKLQHDSEQFRFLAKRHRDGSRFESLARAYDEVAKDFPEKTTRLSGRQIDKLGGDYNTAINICPAPELPGHAVSERTDRAAIMRAFQERHAGAVYFDELLTPPALLWLKQYLHESTIWHDFSHIDGFVASYLEDGLACPLLLQVADEIRQTFPELLETRPLSQAWAFKGLKPSAAVDPHADDAAVSINFWLTSNEANLDPDRGGLTICRRPAPSDWQMKDYNADHGQISQFMGRYPEDALVVPYRENRAVLFESRLFHRSDAPQFAHGYENHRINVTMLFGRHAS
jgi:tetratricopeptide (TPR) repeat protein